MADNWRSKLITGGVNRSPNRAMLRAVGFGDADFDKPIVGVANGHSNMNPCNAGIQPLVDRAMAALEAAGAKPQVFGVPTVTDGIGMGTEGMKYSLVSREVIADAIETSVNGQMMDGALVIGACDKNMPGGMMAIARMNIPAIYVYGGTIKPGHWKGRDLTIASAFEAVGAFAAGKMSKEDFEGVERNACPTVGACGGMFTANTMSSSFEALGMSLLGSSQMAAPDPEKADSAAQSAQVLVNAIKKNIRPRDIITRKSIENVVSLVMATGGSTNAVLHYLAIASAAEVEWTIDDFERIRLRTPVICDLKPSGKYVATDFHKAGGVPVVLKMLLDHGLLHGDCMTITGRTIGEELKALNPVRREDQDVIRAVGQPDVQAGAPRDPQGQPRTRRLRCQDHGPQESGDHRSGARVQLRGGDDGSDHRRQGQGGRRGGDPLRRAQGRAGHAGDALAHLGPGRRGARRIGRSADRRPLLRCVMGHGGGSRGARGVRGRTDRAGAGRRHDHHRCAQAADPDARVRRGTGQAACRVEAAGSRATPRACMAKYVKLVSTASKGAVTDRSD